MPRLLSLFHELRRRGVWRAAVAYAIFGLAVVEGTAAVIEALELGNAVLQPLTILAILGFPVAVVVSWVFEWTPQGFVRHMPDDAHARDRRLRRSAGSAKALAASERRLAVLPLSSIQADGDQDYFAEGMTEELISVLSRTSGLDVIARTSVMQYRATTKTVREIADDLGVAVILQGSVRCDRDRLRVSVQLVDAGTQSHVWSDAWDRQLEDVFAIQSEIARRVASALEVTLLRDDEDLIHREPTSDLTAYDLFLLGRHQLGLRSETGIHKAIEHFEAAVERDPLFAQAWSGLSDCYLLALVGYASIKAETAERAAREAAERALELDESLADAHVAIGYLEANRWNLEGPREHFERALALSPSHAQAHQWYSHYFAYRGEFEHAIEYIERAHTLDPLSNVILNESGWPYLYLGRFAEAAERFSKVVHRDPENAMAYFNLGNCAERTGHPEQAVTYYRAAAELSARVPFITAFLGMALTTIGDRDEAESIADDVERKASRGTPVAACLGALLIRLGRLEEGLGWIERAIEMREPMALAVDTHWMPLPEVRDDPRFIALLDQMPQPSAAGRRP